MADPAGSFLGLLKRPPPEEEEEAGGLGASECGDAGLGGHEAEAEAAGKLETKSESRSPIPPSRSSRAPPAGGGGGLWNEREEAATDAAPAGDELPGSDGGGDPWAWLAGTLWRDTGQPKEYRMLVQEGKILVVLTRRNFENVVEVRRLPSGDLGWGLQPGRGRAKFILSQKDCGNRDEIVWRHGGSSTVSHRWRFIPLELDPPQRSRSPAEREREEQLPRSEAPEGELREGEVWEEGEGVWEESGFPEDPESRVEEEEAPSGGGGGGSSVRRHRRIPRGSVSAAGERWSRSPARSGRRPGPGPAGNSQLRSAPEGRRRSDELRRRREERSSAHSRSRSPCERRRQVDEEAGRGLRIDIFTYGVAKLEEGRWPKVSADLNFDMRNFHDPAAGNLKGHDGHHPEIIARLVRHRGFSDWAGLVRTQLRTAMDRAEAESSAAGAEAPIRGIGIALYCRAGRHRSVASGVILRHILQEEGFGNVCLDHLCLRRCRCAECTGRSGKRMQALQSATDVWNRWRLAHVT